MPICPFATQDPINGPVNSYTGEPFRIVHHVTDGSTYAGARGTYVVEKNEPHFTVDSKSIYQHIDTGKASRSLKNAEGGVETGRASAVQIEVVGFTNQPKDAATLKNVARLCRWIEKTHAVPQTWPNGLPLPPKNGKDPGGHNRDAKTWTAKGGHYGHSHVPENDHWDPAYTADEVKVVMGDGTGLMVGARMAEASLTDADEAPLMAAELASMDGALRELGAFALRPYYDPAADAVQKAAYYGGTDLRVKGEPLYRALNVLLDASHRERLPYKPSRELYPWVDLQPDGTLRSLYTGEVYGDPEAVIREAVQLEAEFEARQRSLLAEASAADAGGRMELVSLLAEAPLYNCEHVVPQSWFKGSGSSIPQGDLHHLFTCNTSCNSFRGSVPFWEFAEWTGQAGDCGRREPNRFEPARGKGPAARAVFYFLLRYPGRIDDVVGEFQASRLELLLRWHAEEPPTEWERHRNAAIHEKQGNRNPLIDFAELAESIPFELGLGGARP